MEKWQPIKAFILLPLMGILVIPTFILLFFSEPHLGWSLAFPFNIFPIVLGFVLIGLGLFLLVETTQLFAKIGKGTLAHWNPPKNLVVCGVYRYVRNPMVWGVLLTILGETVLFGAISLFILFLVAFILNHILFIKWEEPDLARRFGEDYLLYMKNVPRWIPRLTPWKGLPCEDSNAEKNHVLE